MAMGLPCVATDCSSGVRLLTKDGAAARVVPRADSRALAGALSELMGDADLRVEVGARAREAVAPYRADLVIDQWERLIERILR
jgi:glycosyltransferase involved in cell wall biosynthesis